MSETGLQQSDPLGHVLLALSIDDIARSVTLPINVWCLDGATNSGSYNNIIGLDIKHSKCDFIDISCNSFDDFVLGLKQDLPGAKVTQIEDLDLLCAPLRETGCRRSLLTA